MLYRLKNWITFMGVLYNPYFINFPCSTFKTNFSNLSRLEISVPFTTTSFFLSIVMLGCEHATKLKRNKHIKPVFLLLSSPIQTIGILEKATFLYESSFSFPFSFFGKITYENEITVSTKSIIAQT